MTSFSSMMQTEEEFKELVDLEEMYPADLKRLPSMAYRDFGILANSFVGRREYHSHVGFPLLTWEFQRELEEQLHDLEIDTFVEIEAGTGALTTVLNNSNVVGKGYTLDPDTCRGNWGMEKSPIFDHARDMGWLEFQDIRDLELSHTPDIIVASWIPYRGGEEVIEFFNNQEHNSEYFMLIGEGRGGCTANDTFHGWLEENFDHVWTSLRYASFDAIYDKAVIYRRKDPDGLL